MKPSSTIEVSSSSNAQAPSAQPALSLTNRQIIVNLSVLFVMNVAYFLVLSEYWKLLNLSS